MPTCTRASSCLHLVFSRARAEFCSLAEYRALEVDTASAVEAEQNAEHLDEPSRWYNLLRGRGSEATAHSEWLDTVNPGEERVGGEGLFKKLIL